MDNCNGYTLCQVDDISTVRARVFWVADKASVVAGVTYLFKTKEATDDGMAGREPTSPAAHEPR
jgi:hypothetical protein